MFERTRLMIWTVAGGLLTGTAGQTAIAQSTLGKAPGRASAVALLKKSVEKVDWVDTPFEEVIAWLREEGEDRVNILARWNVLSDESVDRDSLINMRLTEATVAEVLNEVIEQLSDSGEIGYRAYGNRITISTRTDFGRKLELVVYDASDILFRVEDMGEEAPQIDLQQTTGGGAGGGGGGGGGGQSVFQGGGSSGGQSSQGGEQAEREMEERLERLRELIENTIAPTTWDTANPPGRGRIRIFNNSLFVVNTIEVQEQIAGTFSFGE